MSGTTLSEIVSSSGTGISTESYRTSEMLEFLAVLKKTSEALSGPKNDALQNLHAVFIENSMNGWDGEDAIPISNKAHSMAEDLLKILPNGFPLPEFVPDPDGQISLEWRKNKYQVVSISIGDTNRFAVAYVNGSDTGYFVERFNGKSVPSQVYHLVRDVITGNYA